jgi:hypothetical protein
MERGSNSTRKYLDISGGDILSAKGGPVVKSAGNPGKCQLFDTLAKNFLGGPKNNQLLNATNQTGGLIRGIPLDKIPM